MGRRAGIPAAADDDDDEEAAAAVTALDRRGPDTIPDADRVAEVEVDDDEERGALTLWGRAAMGATRIDCGRARAEEDDEAEDEPLRCSEGRTPPNSRSCNVLVADGDDDVAADVDDEDEPLRLRRGGAPPLLSLRRRGGNRRGDEVNGCTAELSGKQLNKLNTDDEPVSTSSSSSSSESPCARRRWLSRECWPLLLL